MQPCKRVISQTRFGGFFFVCTFRDLASPASSGLFVVWTFRHLSVCPGKNLTVPRAQRGEVGRVVRALAGSALGTGQQGMCGPSGPGNASNIAVRGKVAGWQAVGSGGQSGVYLYVFFSSYINKPP